VGGFEYFLSELDLKRANNMMKNKLKLPYLTAMKLNTLKPG